MRADVAARRAAERLEDLLAANAQRAMALEPCGREAPGVRQHDSSQFALQQMLPRSYPSPLHLAPGQLLQGQAGAATVLGPYPAESQAGPAPPARYQPDRD